MQSRERSTAYAQFDNPRDALRDDDTASAPGGVYVQPTQEQEVVYRSNFALTPLPHRAQATVASVFRPAQDIQGLGTRAGGGATPAGVQFEGTNRQLDFRNVQADTAFDLSYTPECVGTRRCLDEDGQSVVTADLRSDMDNPPGPTILKKKACRAFRPGQETLDEYFAVVNRVVRMLNMGEASLP